ncbi:MAG: hypothetical protein D6721_06620, partial [Gammaproteobacteria bacterium]
AASLASCGGGGTVAGIGGTGITTVGTITGFGSIIVNGVHYDITSATIKKEGKSVNDKDPNTALREGMVVTVKGVDYGNGTGSASEVSYRDELQGPVDAGSPASQGFSVMGIPISVDASTRFSKCSDDGVPPVTGWDPSTQLNAGDLVEVSGYPKPGGGIQATYVEKKDGKCQADDKGDQEIKGTLYAGGASIQVGESTPISIDTTSASCKDPINDLGLTPGFVELKGSYTGGKFCVTDGENEDEHAGKSAQAGAHADLEGLVSDLNGANQTFRLNSTSMTVYYGSATVTGTGTLANSVHVEVKGTFNSNGDVNASEVHIE